MDNDNSAIESTDDAAARWLARHHRAQFKLQRWAPDPLLALRMRDDSMCDGTWGGRGYPEGCTVIVDPTIDPQPGRRVVVEGMGGLIICRELGLRRKKFILKPVNPAHETIPLAPWHKIRGVVVQVHIMTEAGKSGELEWAAQQAAQEATAAA